MNKYAKYLAEIGRSAFAGTFAMPRVHCVSCAATTRFLVSGAESRSIRCLRCRSTAISLSVVDQIQRLPLDPARHAAYELSYHGAVYRHLQSHFPRFQCSEYFGPPAGGVLVNGVRNEDVQQLSFADESFDLVTSTEVFEHVPDYRRGFAEVRRVTRPGGWFVFTVPWFDDDRTRETARLRSDGTVEWLAEPEYHDSQVGGVGSVPVFWHHSKRQVTRDLLEAGFSHAELVSSAAYRPQIQQHVAVARR